MGPQCKRNCTKSGWCNAGSLTARAIRPRRSALYGVTMRNLPRTLWRAEFRAELDRHAIDLPNPGHESRAVHETKCPWLSGQVLCQPFRYRLRFLVRKHEWQPSEARMAQGHNSSGLSRI